MSSKQSDSYVPNMQSRISEVVTHGREADTSSSRTRLASASASTSASSTQFASLPKATDANSLPPSQSAAKAGHLSLSTQSFTSHRRNNSITVIWPPTKSSISPISPASKPSSTSRPSSSPAPSPSPSLQSLPTPLLSPIASSLPQQPGVLGITPPTRRQPASRSSHGIETSTGPPPALITQRSYTESAWKHPPSMDSAAARPHPTYRSKTEHSIDSVIHRAQFAPDEHQSVNLSKLTGRVSRQAEEVEGKMAATPASSKQRQSLDDDQDPTLRNLMRPASSHAATTMAETKMPAQNQRHGQSKGSQEDLFLNLARSNSLVDDATKASTKGERRRSRTINFNSRKARASVPPTDARPSSSGRRFLGHSITPSQDSATQLWDQSSHCTDLDSSHFTNRSSSKERRYAASAHPLDQRRRSSHTVSGANVSLSTPRLRSGSNRETSPELPVPYGRRRSVRDSSPDITSRAYKQSNLSYAANDHFDSSPFEEAQNSVLAHGKKPQVHHAEGTESTVSTTAPSTIWDEVEDLKHRMRKLELTGKLPVSSDAAIANVFGERPPTATTTMTTISSSPKHGRVDSLSPGATTVRGPETADIHPLLHSALAKSKPLVDPTIYRALEAAASDALTLAARTAPGAQAPSSATGIDRQLRRKADSMCRSLTELCIALTEEKSERDPPTSLGQSRSGDASVSIHHSVGNGQETRYMRASSEDPDMRSSSRVMSRLEARRASLAHLNNPHSRRASPQETMTPTPPPATTKTAFTASSRLETPSVTRRTSTINPNERPTSRAITEIARFRPSASSAERAPREYTSQQPLPSPTQPSPSVPLSLPARRSFFSATPARSPTTPNVQPGSRRYQDRGTTPPSSVESARAAEMRRERMASLGGYGNGAGTLRAAGRPAGKPVEGDGAS